MRLLSCETPDEHQSVIFSDNVVHGVVVGIHFFIKDCSARGFQKKFSLAVINDEQYESAFAKVNGSIETDLVANLNEITSFFESIIEVLKSEYGKNKENGEIRTISTEIHQDTKIETLDHDSPIVNFPRIEYTYLHKTLSHFLLQFAPKKVT